MAGSSKKKAKKEIHMADNSYPEPEDMAAFMKTPERCKCSVAGVKFDKNGDLVCAECGEVAW